MRLQSCGGESYNVKMLVNWMLLPIVLLAVCYPVWANIFLDNLPRIIDRASEPYLAPVGELESFVGFIGTNGKSQHRFGTGVLVSPCYILTNAHVALGKDAVVRPNAVYEMTFRAGVGKTAPFAGSTVATLVLSSERALNGGDDWALMRLKSCIGSRREYGWFEPTSKSSLSLVNERVMVVGYAANSTRGVITGSIGKVMGVNENNGNLLVSASLTNGQSGGAILVLESGELKIAGMPAFQNRDLANINQGEFKTYTRERANEVVHAGAVMNQRPVRALLQDDIARWGIINPNAERARSALLQ